jgi:hypothetical protein
MQSAIPAINDVSDIFGTETKHWGGDVGKHASDDGPKIFIICREVDQKLLLLRVSFGLRLGGSCQYAAPCLLRALNAATMKPKSTSHGGCHHSRLLSSPARWGCSARSPFSHSVGGNEKPTQNYRSCVNHLIRAIVPLHAASAHDENEARRSRSQYRRAERQRLHAV